MEARINPDSIQILSYPGPDASIKVENLNKDKVFARRYRNRRIGEFLKELKLTEGRSTGIPTVHRAMLTNGSPPPYFGTDEERTYFLVELLIHPEVTPEVLLINALTGEMSRNELQKAASRNIALQRRDKKRKPPAHPPKIVQTHTYPP